MHGFQPLLEPSYGHRADSQKKKKPHRGRPPGGEINQGEETRESYGSPDFSKNVSAQIQNKGKLGMHVSAPASRHPDTQDASALLEGITVFHWTHFSTYSM